GKIVSCKVLPIPEISTAEEIPFELSFNVQGKKLSGKATKDGLQILSFSKLPSSVNAVPLWIPKGKDSWYFKPNALLQEPVLLPKSFKENGVLVGDQGNFSYYSTGAISLSEQRLPFYVVGFYDPGIIPIGGKLVLARNSVVSLIRGASHADEKLLPSGLNVNFIDYKKAHEVQKKIQENLQKAGILPYFKVQAFDQYDFSKDIFQQLKSEKNLFSLIAFI